MTIVPQSFLSLQDLTKAFGKVIAVDKVSLHIEKGKFFALLGPSGCGKTTTLRLVAGLEKPSSGRIFIDGRDVTALPPQKRDVAMVFQDYALYPHMTLRQNIGYPLKVRGFPKKSIATRVEEVAEHLMIADILDRLPSQVSGGQQQRAAVARAIVHAPKIFLFDEPLSNLDAKLRLEARAFLKHLQKELGITTVYVTHDQAEAMAMADEIGVMFAGRVVQVGSPLELYRYPKNRDVAAFIGNPPMNILPGRLEPKAGGSQFSGEGYTLFFESIHVLEDTRAYLGFRPEQAQLMCDLKDSGIPAQLYAVQPLGSEVLITLLVGTETVYVKLYSESLPALPDLVRVKVDPSRLYLFDSTGACIKVPK